MLQNGLYEQLINKCIKNNLDEAQDKLAEIKRIDEAESSKIIAQYLTDIIEKGLDCISDKNVIEKVNLANKIVHIIKSETKDDDFEQLSVDENAEQLLALLDKKDNIYAVNNKIAIPRPDTSLAQSSLFTGAVNEPQMMTELKKEIVSCDRIDLLVSFIKWSGLVKIINELKSFTDSGGRLRIITTSYMGATDVKAVEELKKLENTEIKVSYDTKRTRLHAKAYVFYRDTGFTTAYVGSSNLSNAAISSGLEWNVKVTRKDLPETIQKIEATFESYWNSNEFEEYRDDSRERLEKALFNEKYHKSNNDINYLFDIIPYYYQQEILDKLKAEREIRGYYQNLVVAATGTGKTVISAFDYRNFCKLNKGKKVKLLFVAHRKEILDQSIACFRGVLKDQNFGEQFYEGNRPSSIEHLFISIQTFNSQNFITLTSQNFYDYIIIDEFHHAAAEGYQKLLNYYKPKILLGLTATPERMDGKDILKYFNNRIAAEIRLPEAIDRKLLCPFQYFGVTDTVDLSALKWTNGGYDKSELSNIYTLNSHVAEKRANMVVQSTLKYINRIDEVKGLGFCVSKKHAEFMSDHFNLSGIPSMFLTSDTSDEERESAKKRLIDGEIRFIFVVDIYNEGVDIPEVNTVLFLRPTESLTIFLQQLGRGLRLCDKKDCLTVLDFIGQANKNYNFDDKFSALLSGTRIGIQKEIDEGFISVPKGCYIELERKAKEYILDNIKESLGVKKGLVSRIASFEDDTNQKLTLESFLSYYHIDIRTIYKSYSFSRLCKEAGVIDDFNEELEEIMTKAFSRICVIDSRRWIKFLLDTFENLDSKDIRSFTDIENRMLQMFQFTVWLKSFEECGFSNLSDGLYKIKNNFTMYKELIEILKYKYNTIDFIDEQVKIGFDCPLDLYCSYSRDQILVAMDFMKPSTVREGVKYLPDKKVDVLFVTLNKSEKYYSPTTMYNDYSINEYLFHWQSQSTTSDNSPTGLRYINHNKLGNNVVLFVREYKNDNTGAAPYTYLGLVDYVKHEGSKPMNITWRLRKPIPARFISKTNKMIIG